MHEPSASAKSFILLGIITIAASFTPIFARVAVSEISPLSLGFLRFGLAAVLFFIVSIIRKSNFTFEKKDYLKLVLLGALGIPINQYFFLTGINLSYASHSGVIYSLNPVFAYITAVLRKHEKFYLSKVFAILLTIAGIFIVFYESIMSKTENKSVLQGDILLVLAVLSFSLYISLGKEFIDKYGALKVTTFAFLAGSLLDLPVFLLDMHNLNMAGLSWFALFSFFYLAIVISFIAYFSWYYILKTIRISILTTVSNLSPVLTVFFSVILLHEKISLYFIIGAIITVLGVMVMHKISVELA
jgi:drug/metabolite transporter (DMT)-like permease